MFYSNYIAINQHISSYILDFSTINSIENTQNKNLNSFYNKVFDFILNKKGMKTLLSRYECLG